MDQEDRDHFKTIAEAQVEPQIGSSKPQSAGNSALAPDPIYCLKAAKVLFGSYRKDEVNDPDIYCAAVAATFSDFPKEVIDSVADPRTGIASEIRWVPNIAEVRSYCVRAAARRDELAKPAFRFERREYVPPVKREPGTSYFEMFEKYGRPVGRFEYAGDQWNRHIKPSTQADSKLQKSDLMKDFREKDK